MTNGGGGGASNKPKIFRTSYVHDPLPLISAKGTRILVCGGASANDTILQVISDIFNAPVFTKVRTYA